MFAFALRDQKFFVELLPRFCGCLNDDFGTGQDLSCGIIIFAFLFVCHIRLSKNLFYDGELWTIVRIPSIFP